MKFELPTWQLKGETCAYCSDGELIFSVCPVCKNVILICGECGTAYEIEHKKKGKEVGDITGATLCHNCGNTFQHKFTSATSDEIQALGFAPEEYQ
jgi:hypothetical protein